MRLLLAGGKTGGHLFPGISVAKQWLRQEGNEVLFVGTRDGLEARILPQQNLPVRYTAASGLKRVGLVKTLFSLLRLPLAFLQGLWIVLRFRPDAVLSLGSFAAGPVCLAAWFLHKPLVLLEPNSVPGMTNRQLGRFAKKVALSFGHAGQWFDPDKTVLTGTPVRQEFLDRFDASEEKTREISSPLRILILGGSQGATFINNLFREAAPELKTLDGQLTIRHQTGATDQEAVAERYRETGLDAEATAFIDDMAGALAWSHLVVARSGAATCAELAVAGRPSLLIPFPGAADNHQVHNAAELVEAGAAWVREQQDIDAPELVRFIKERIADPEELARMSGRLESAAHPRAAEHIARLLEEVAQD